MMRTVVVTSPTLKVRTSTGASEVVSQRSSSAVADFDQTIRASLARGTRTAFIPLRGCRQSDLAEQSHRAESGVCPAAGRSQRYSTVPSSPW